MRRARGQTAERPAGPAARYTAHVTPHEQYAARQAAREARRAALQRQSNRLSSVRLALAALVLAMAWMAWYAHWFTPVWIALPALAFAAAVVAHVLAGHRLAHASRQVEFYRRALARLEERWAGTGDRGTLFENDQHLYASDLDVFGEGSLFELLCAARTPMGARKLADWLLAPADRAEIERRHQEIADLAPRLDQRERIASFAVDATAAA
ncbi:DNA mismatch repair protein MutS domain protein, partial [mine drainage metagenome]